MTTREDLAPSRGTSFAPADGSERRTFVRRHPRLAFAAIAVGLTWAVQLTFLALGWPLFPAMVVELVTLAVTATVITRSLSGRAGVRRLYAGVLRWRFGVRWWAAALTVVPIATVAVAGAAGTLQGPADGWGLEALQYVFLAVVFGALLGNMWEELAWTGFFQAEMTDRHGLLKGALVTAVPFGLIHLPLAFEADGLGGTSLRDLAIDLVAAARGGPVPPLPDRPRLPADGAESRRGGGAARQLQCRRRHDAGDRRLGVPRRHRPGHPRGDVGCDAVRRTAGRVIEPVRVAARVDRQGGNTMLTSRSTRCRQSGVPPRCSSAPASLAPQRGPSRSSRRPRARSQAQAVQLLEAKLRPSGDPDGSGQADFRLRKAKGKVCATVTWSNIEAPDAAHIHRKSDGGSSSTSPARSPAAGTAPPGCRAS